MFNVNSCPLLGGKGNPDEADKRSAESSKGISSQNQKNQRSKKRRREERVEKKTNCIVGYGISDCKFWKAPMEVMRPIWERVGPFMDETVEEDGKRWEVVRDNPLNEKFRYYCCMFFHSFFSLFSLLCPLSTLSTLLSPKKGR